MRWRQNIVATYKSVNSLTLSPPIGIVNLPKAEQSTSKVNILTADVPLVDVRPTDWQRH